MGEFAGHRHDYGAEEDELQGFEGWACPCHEELAGASTFLVGVDIRTCTSEQWQCAVTN